MHKTIPLREVIDLTDPDRNMIFNMSLDQARKLVASGNPQQTRTIDGHFALVARKGSTIRLARSLGIPMRYFLAKREDGPILIVAHRIDTIHTQLSDMGLSDQFHPSYTRMVPAHYITEIALVGCPDPNPTYQRFFRPERESLEPSIDVISKQYIEALQNGIQKWLHQIPSDEPIGVCFSGGIDSGAVFLMTYHAICQAGMNPGRLKAFTLSVDGDGDDLLQAKSFLESLDLSLFLEPIEVSLSDINFQDAIRVIEDYKPLDIQAATMNLALCRGIRERYPDWKYLIDGDGGDENLKDYPIEENPELTIRSVLNNLMLYHEGWGVDSVKHSLTYSGGLSRSYARTCAPTSFMGFKSFSPFTLPDVIEVSEGIPFIELTQWSHDRLYALKGEIVSQGIEAVTGKNMPVYPKRRFQHGAIKIDRFRQHFPESETPYRHAYQAMYHG